MARGGRRSGAPGATYANRSDLHQPVAVPTGGQYGQGKALADAQKALPLPKSAPQPVTPGPAPAAAPADALSAAQSFAFPDTAPFDRPTDRPAEPGTTGLPIGPGPGPEALATPDYLGSVIGALSANRTDPAVARMLTVLSATANR